MNNREIDIFCEKCEEDYGQWLCNAIKEFKEWKKKQGLGEAFV